MSARLACSGACTAPWAKYRKNGFAGVGGLDLADHPHGAVGEVVGEVVAVGVLVDVDDGVALVQAVRVVEVGERFEEPVVLVEPALQRPRVLVAGFGQVGVLAQVPLADREGGVAVGAEHLGHRRLVLGQLAGVAGEPGVDVGDLCRRPTACALRPVSSAARVGEHSGATWKLVYRSPLAARASRLGVGISAAVAAEVGEAEVVGHHHDDVRRALRRRAALAATTAPTWRRPGRPGPRTRGRRAVRLQLSVRPCRDSSRSVGVRTHLNRY